MLLPTAWTITSARTNPVRAVEAFVDELDLAGWVCGVVPEATGRPLYHPARCSDLSLRLPEPDRVEPVAGAETQRNLELMWLTGRLMRTSRPSPTSAATTDRQSRRPVGSSCCCAGS